MDYPSAAQGPKHANVYLPAGYDPSARYDVLYVMHGGGGNAEICLDPARPTPLSRILDARIAEGTLRPLIVVSPSYYADDAVDRSPGGSEPLVKQFPRELLESLMPAVEGRFATWAPTPDAEGFRASRQHRAFGGFSMGSVTTWYVFLELLDCFAEYVPMSGDCWAVAVKGGEPTADVTAALLADVAERFGRPLFRMQVYTGSRDMAQTHLTPQLQAMAAHAGTFVFGESGNMSYKITEGAKHCYDAVWGYLADAMPGMFD